MLGHDLVRGQDRRESWVVYKRRREGRRSSPPRPQPSFLSLELTILYADSPFPLFQINTVSDALAQAATSYSPTEIAFLKLIVRPLLLSSTSLPQLVSRSLLTTSFSLSFAHQSTRAFSHRSKPSSSLPSLPTPSPPSPPLDSSQTSRRTRRLPPSRSRTSRPRGCSRGSVGTMGKGGWLGRRE